MLYAWTKEETETVLARWAEGRSAAEIAREVSRRFGIRRSRNAVIGLIHRRGAAELGGRRGRVSGGALRTKPRVPPPPKAKAPPPKPKPKSRPPETVPAVAISAEPILPAIFPDSNVGCRWIEGDPGGPRCDAPRRSGSPYCPEHHARAYVPVTPQQRQSLRRSLLKWA